jgi:hypothetical protein
MGVKIESDALVLLAAIDLEDGGVTDLSYVSGYGEAPPGGGWAGCSAALFASRGSGFESPQLHPVRVPEGPPTEKPQVNRLTFMIGS